MRKGWGSWSAACHHAHIVACIHSYLSVVGFLFEIGEFSSQGIRVFKCFTLVEKLVVKEGNTRCVWWKHSCMCSRPGDITSAICIMRLDCDMGNKNMHGHCDMGNKNRYMVKSKTSPCHVNGNALQWQLKRLHLNNKLASLWFKQMLVRFAGAGRQINTFLAPSITKGPSHGRTVDLDNCQWLANKLEQKLSPITQINWNHLYIISENNFEK